MLKLLSIDWMRCWQRPGFPEKFRKKADAIDAPSYVKNDKYRCLQLFWKARGQNLERFHTSGRGPDHDNILFRHARCLPGRPLIPGFLCSLTADASSGKMLAPKI